MLNTLYWMGSDEEAASAIEYGLIAALVSVAGIAALTEAGNTLEQLLCTSPTSSGSAEVSPDQREGSTAPPYGSAGRMSVALWSAVTPSIRITSPSLLPVRRPTISR